jgi:hypothetical protein
VTDIIENYESGFYVGGYSYSGISGDKTDANKGFADFWLLKLDALGNPIWQKTIGGDQGDYLYSIYENSDHTIALGGYSESGISGDKTENSRGMSDMWLLKLSESGTIIWQKTIGGNQHDGIQCIKKTSQNEYLLGGNSRSSISGDKSENCRGETDFWFVKLAYENLSLLDNSLQKDIIVYPTLTTGEVSIILNDKFVISKSILTDALGRTCEIMRDSSNKIKILGEPGLYFLTIMTTNGQKQTFKIVKVNR